MTIHELDSKADELREIQNEIDELTARPRPSATASNPQ